jgi:hypothetical protein
MNSDCAGNQETLMHIAAKEIIAEKKRLCVRGRNRDQEVVLIVLRWNSKSGHIE